MADECILPEEILHYIFLRMPTKPLLQLKCLSKHWNCVISDPRFMKARSRRMILAPALSLHAIDISVQGNDMNHSMIELRFPYAMLEDKEVTIVGSFNGIVFLVLEKAYRPHELILYNPFTGAFKIVPRPPSWSHYTNYVYGFGYGTTLDDLKIIRITVYCSANGGSRLYDIFSLKSGSWSSPSELIGNYHFLKYSGTFVNGFLYWVAAGVDLRQLIVALDIKKMVFSEITIPSGCHWNCLGTFDGRLCMICKTNDLELWILNDLDSGNIWSKKCSAKYPSISDHGTMSRILCVLDDGKLLLLMSLSNQLIVYDMFKESYKEVNTLTSFGKVWNVESKSIEYVESLISPAAADMCSTLI